MVGLDGASGLWLGGYVGWMARPVWQECTHKTLTGSQLYEHYHRPM